MKIEKICTFNLTGKPPVPEGFWEERLVRPVDIYERFRGIGPEVLGYHEEFKQTFLEITADDCNKGFFGPINQKIGRIIEEDLKPIIRSIDRFSRVRVKYSPISPG